MLTLLAFLLAIGVLVTFHELGHFLVARWCGVKVLRFAVGFGSPLFSRYWRGTEWVICPVPLGGYVRMLDEREGPVDPSELDRAFNRQPVLKRMAIVAAGPLANLLLAVLIYWVVVAQGVTEIRPAVGMVVKESPAAMAGFQAGDRIASLDGAPVENWQAVRLALAERLGGAMAGPAMRFEVVTAAGAKATRTLDLARDGKRFAADLASGNIGISPVRLLPVIGAVDPEGAAARAGLKEGDRLLAVDGKPLSDWNDWVEIIRNSPGKPLTIRIERKGAPQDVLVRPAGVPGEFGYVGRIGAAPQSDEAWMRSISYTRQYDAGAAAIEALRKTGDTAWMSLRFLGRMLIGQASLDNLSGPLTIAAVAGQTARQGWTSYLEFMALISISIGVLNLLPIPVLDGGHLMYYTAELIKGKPLSERAQLMGQRIGFALLASLMAFALLNDISRLFGG
ncbi:RIP metalloprotease RseP [Paludibacterium paludis]|uniref:Zinc metalloprotease n=1 Tax=Paludibacterium paludis TaxID=1225769 RepID=A0A918UBJ1_9NEIS|nr:RIP metalloprotease RseP [Paludibacterium paludis]GGY25581.1 putative zinc metalloprotease [Paludibacterium paludis]